MKLTDLEGKQAEGFAISLQIYLRGAWTSEAALKLWLGQYSQMREAFELYDWFRIITKELAAALRRELKTQNLMVCLKNL